MRAGIITSEQIESLDALALRLSARGLEDESRTLREVMRQLADGPRELPAAAAAELLTVTPQTVRNWVRGGILPGRQDSTGHFYVGLEALEPALCLHALSPDAPAGPVTDDEIDAEIEVVRAERRARRISGLRSPMMSKRMSVLDARAGFADLVGDVCHTQEPVIIESDGRPVAVVISPDQFERWQQDVMDRFREARDELQRLNDDKDPDAVLRDVTEAVEEVRRAEHERQHLGR